MSVESKQLIDEYYKKAHEAKSSDEKKYWLNKVRNLENGCCPLCNAELPNGHRLK